MTCTRHEGRRIATLAGIAAVTGCALALPVVAAGATAPVVKNPTPASLKQDRPLFGWTNGPAGEYVEQIAIRTASGVEEDGRLIGGDFAANVPTAGVVSRSATRARTAKPLTAGTYFWNTRWRDPADEQTPRYTGVRSFRIAPRIANVRIREAIQLPGTLNLRFVGTVASNTESFRITCVVTLRGRALSRQVLNYGSLVPSRVQPIGCLRLTVPQSALGQRVALRVTVAAQGKKATATRMIATSRAAGAGPGNVRVS